MIERFEAWKWFTVPALRPDGQAASIGCSMCYISKSAVPSQRASRIVQCVLCARTQLTERCQAGHGWEKERQIWSTQSKWIIALPTKWYSHTQTHRRALSLPKSQQPANKIVKKAENATFTVLTGVCVWEARASGFSFQSWFSVLTLCAHCLAANEFSGRVCRSVRACACVSIDDPLPRHAQITN